MISKWRIDGMFTIYKCIYSYLFQIVLVFLEMDVTLRVTYCYL